MPLSIYKFRNTIILSVPFQIVVFWKVGNAKWRVDGEWFVARGNSKRERKRNSEVARREHPKRVDFRALLLAARAWETEQRTRVSAPSPADFGPNGARTRSDYNRRVLKDQRAYIFSGQRVARRERVRGWNSRETLSGGRSCFLLTCQTLVGLIETGWTN